MLKSSSRRPSSLVHLTSVSRLPASSGLILVHVDGTLSVSTMTTRRTHVKPSHILVSSLYEWLVSNVCLMTGLMIGCGGNMNRFVSVKNCYKLCHPYYRQQVIESETPGTLENSVVTGQPVLMPQQGTDAQGNVITTMVPVIVKSVSGGMVQEDKGMQDPDDGVDSQMVMIQPAKK